MKVSELVRHKALPDWGIGVVVEVSRTAYEINFEGRGRRRIAHEFVDRFLELVDATEVAPDSALLDRGRWSELEPPPEERKKGGVRSGDQPCEHCGKPLKRSQYAADKRKKSCPRCSANDGRQHVLTAA